MTKSNTPLKGLGTDIIEIERIAQMIERYGIRWLSKLFTEKEIAYCQRYAFPARHFAGRFAAKESVAKALGCGIGKYLGWKDLEIVNSKEGQPRVILAPQRAEDFNHPHLTLSISHCKSYATAVAIWT